MKFKRLFIVSLLLIILISISTSFAADISADYDDFADNSNDIEINENIQNGFDEKIVSLYRTNDTDLRDFDSDSSFSSDSDSVSDSDSSFSSDSDFSSDSGSVSSSDSGSVSSSDSIIKSSQSESNSSLGDVQVSDEIDSFDFNTSFINLGINFTDSNTIFVNASYTGSTESGTQANPYKSVNTAFSKLISGYTSTKRNLFIADGSYELSSYLSITKSINIIGESALNTILSIKTAKELLFVKTNNLYVNIFNLTLSGGSSDSGGALYANRSYVNVVNTIFKENSAVESSSYYATYYANGGAVFNEAGDMNIYNCTFVNNKATGDLDSYGAAIYNFMGNLSVFNSEFINNTINATFGTGGAIYGYSGFLNVVNSSFINNTIYSNYSLGGAISVWHGHRTLVLNSTIEENTITGNYTFGLAIAHQGRVLQVENTKIRNNNALGIALDNESIYNMNGNFISSNVIEENNFFNSFDSENLLLCLEDQIAITRINDDSIELPSSYDLRDEGLVSPVTDQGSTGSCWAFATLAALESYLMKTENVTYDFSEQNLRNLMGYYGTNGTDWDDGGNHIMSLAYLLRWSGPINESDDPFNSYSSRSSYDLDRVKHVQDVLYVPLRTSYLDNDEIKYAILKYGALYTTIYSDSYFQYRTNYYSPWADYSNHAVTLVGWDDNYPASKFTSNTPPGDGAFVIKNSWGTDYGDDGYWYISYYDKAFAGFGVDTIAAMAFTNVENVTNYKDIYQYDILGNTYESVGYNSNTAWMANQFTATSNNPLSAFGLYSFGDSSIYMEVYVNGNLKHTQNSSVMGAGYHTIKLDDFVSLKIGDIFRINVEITTPGSKFPVAIESQRTGFSSKATASLGQSYVSPDGENWYDIARNTDILKFYEYMIGNHTLYKTNVCLKAYTSYAGNLQLNISSNSSLFSKGDLIEITYNITNIGDFIEDINVSLYLDESIYPNDLISISKGTFDTYDNLWSIPSLDAGESAVLKIRVYMSEKLEEVENFAYVQTSGFNVADSNYQSFKLYYSGWTKFLAVENITTFTKSGDEVMISLVDALNRPIANKEISIALVDGESVVLETNRNGTVIFNLNLTEGNYTYIVSFDGDDEFDASNLTFNVSANRISSFFAEDNLESINILSLSNEEIQFELFDQFSNPIANKAIFLTDKNSGYVFEILTDENGLSRYNFNLTKGSYDFRLSFDGDEIYSPASVDFAVEVSKRDSPIILVGSNVLNYTERFTVVLVDNQFNILSDKSINLIFSGAKSLNYTLSTDEDGLVSLLNLTRGDYAIEIIFENDGEYEDAFKTVNLMVLGKEIFIETDDLVKYYGDKSPYSINLTEGETVIFEINNASFEVIADSDDKASVDIDLSPGEYEIISHYNGTSYINAISIKETISASDILVDYRDDCNYVLSFLDSLGNPLVNSTVEISINGNITPFVTDENGTLTIPFENLKEKQIIDISNPANNETKQVVIDVYKKTRNSSKIIFENMVTTAVAQADGRIGEYFNVVLMDGDNQVLANKEVKIGFNGKVYNKTTDENGTAKLQINLPAQGTYTFAIAFLGDDDYTGSFDVAKITVNLQTPVFTTASKTYKLNAKTKTISAVLKTSQGNYVSGKTVSFTINGKVYTGKTNSKGVATVNVSLNKKGTYSFTAKFDGDNTFKASKVTGKLTVK